MRIGWLAFLLTLCTASAFATVVEVPVTRDVLRPAAGETARIASDGRDFLVAWTDRRLAESWHLLAVPIDAEGRTLGEAVRLPASPGSKSRPVFVVWAGNVYVVGWHEPERRELHYVRFNRDGRILDVSPRIISDVEAISTAPGMAAAARDGRTLIVFMYDARAHGVLLDSQGELLKRMDISVSDRSRTPAVAAATTGFLVVGPQPNFFVITPVSRDGVPAAQTHFIGLGTPIGTTDNFVVTSRGDESLLAFVDRGLTATARIDANAKVLSFRTIPSVVAPKALVPYRDGYLLAGSAGVAVLLDRDGNEIGTRPLSATAGGDDLLGQSVAFASNGSTTIMAWADRRGVHAHVLDGHSEDAPLSLTPASQSDVRIATNGDGFLVAFRELDAVRVARVSARGRPLDYDGIVVGFSKAPPSVVFDGRNYVVAWIVDGTIRVNRISPDGTLLDGPDGLLVPEADPVDRPDLPEVGLGSNGRETLLAWAEGRKKRDAMYAIRMQQDGTFDPRPFQVASDVGSWRRNELAIGWCRGIWLVVWSEEYFLPTWHPLTSYRVQAARINDAGIVLDGIPFLVHDKEWDRHYKPAIATDGREFLVVWRGGFNAIYARRIGISGLMGFEPIFNRPFFVASAPSTGPSVIWRGDDYLIAWSSNVSHLGRGSDLFHRTLRGSALPLTVTPDSEENPRLVPHNGDFAVAYERLATESPYHGTRRVFLRLDVPKTRATRP